MPAKLTLRVSVFMAMSIYTYFVHSALMLRYGLANEESFQSLSEESTGDLSANGKRKGRAAVENQRTVKSGRRCDLEVDRVIYRKKDHVCGMYFTRTIMSPLRLIQCLSLSSFCDSITLPFQNFKQGKSG